MIGVELVRDRATKEPAASEAAAVKRHCRERGVLIGVGGTFGNVVRMQPPLVIGEEDLDRAIRVIEEAVTSLSRNPSASRRQGDEGGHRGSPMVTLSP